MEPRSLAAQVRAYGQRRLAEVEPHGYPSWMDAPQRRILRSNPYALFVAFSLNGGMKADAAWNAPQTLVDRGITLDPRWIAAHADAVRAAVAQPPVVHRYKTDAAECIVRGAERILALYGGVASRIWSRNPRARDVVRRLDDFYWIGPEKATFATGFLYESLRVPMRDAHELDVKVDVHVMRVTQRAGIATSADPVEIRAGVRAAYPSAPFEVDRGLWFIGSEFCHATAPNCAACPLTALCPKLVAVAASSPAGTSMRRRRTTGAARAPSSAATQRTVYDPRARRARIEAGLNGASAEAPHSFGVGDRVTLVARHHRGLIFTVRALEPHNAIAPIILWRSEPYAAGNRKYLAVFPQEIAAAASSGL